MNKTALITGINGQDGSYLAEFLLDKGYKVYGTLKRNSVSENQTSRLNNIFNKLNLYYADLTDMSSLVNVLQQTQPDEIYNLAAQSHVKISFDQPIYTANATGLGTLNLLEALRILNQKPMIQFCGTSEVYGQVREDEIPIKETQSIDPVNVYAISKLTQEKLVKSYMRSYDIPCVITRAFGYINPRRPDIFSSAFAKQIVDIERGKQDILFHGNLDSVRTLLDVRDVVDAYWVAAEKCDVGEAYNIGSTVPVRVGDFLEELKKQANCKIVSKEDPNLLRPVDVTLQIPSVDKFYQKTNWTPKYNLEDSVKLLLDFYRNQ